MNVEQTDDYAALSDAVAKVVIETVTQKPDALICIAGGDTPLGVFAALVHASKQGKVDFPVRHLLAWMSGWGSVRPIKAAAGRWYGAISSATWPCATIRSVSLMA
jgi:6-phosphogluconolactonase/Glucosamine-6-phosphate isomerase/deaminase